MYGVFFQIEALIIISEKCRLPQIFFLDTKSTCSVLLSVHSFKVAEHSLRALITDSVGDAIKRVLGLW